MISAYIIHNPHICHSIRFFHNKIPIVIKNTNSDRILVGRKPVLDALQGGDQLEKVWIDSKIKGDFEKDIRALTRESSTPLQYIPREKLNSLSGNSNHQGIAAQLSIVEYQTLEELLPFLYEQGKTPAILVLDGVEDVRNIGALARSAVWFGFDGIVVPMKRTARINSFAYKSSAGAIKDIPVCRVSSLTKALELMKTSGLTLVLADSNDNEKPGTPNLTEPIALIMGSENKGVAREVKQMADDIMTIPGSGKVDSLNVSVAGAVLMYQIFEARNK